MEWRATPGGVGIGRAIIRMKEGGRSIGIDCALDALVGLVSDEHVAKGTALVSPVLEDRVCCLAEPFYEPGPSRVR